MFRTFLSWRYLFARRTNLIGIVGILVGVGALILILSIMTGFLEESRRTVRGSLADLLIQPYQEGYAPGQGVPRSAAPLLEAVRDDPRVKGAAAQLQYGGIVTQEGRGYERILTSQSHWSLLAVQLVGVDVHSGARLAAPMIRASVLAVGGTPPRLRIQDEFDATDFLTGLAQTDPSERVAHPLFPFAPRPTTSRTDGRRRRWSSASSSSRPSGCGSATRSTWGPWCSTPTPVSRSRTTETS